MDLAFGLFKASAVTNTGTKGTSQCLIQKQKAACCTYLSSVVSFHRGFLQVFCYHVHWVRVVSQSACTQLIETGQAVKRKISYVGSKNYRGCHTFPNGTILASRASTFWERTTDMASNSQVFYICS